MYLTKLELNPVLRDVRRDLANPYELHRTLSRAVANALGEGRERILWRLEPVGRHAPPVVLVQSLTLPDWDAVLARTPGYAWVHPPKPFDAAVGPGERLVFRLRANPTVRQALRRRAIKTRDGKVAWLTRQLAHGGCALEEVEIREDVFLRAFKSDRTITVQATWFEGLLRVEDASLFADLLRRGIGPAKCLGLGLLSVCRR